MNQLSVFNATQTQVLVYYIFVFISFCFFAYHYRKEGFFLLVILLFFNGLFGFLGKDAQNIYRIVITLSTVYWVFKFGLFKYISGTAVILSSVFFTVTFLATSILNDDYLQITFSQYSRFFILFSLFFILLIQRHNNELRESLDKLIFQLFILQIALSLVKFFIMGTTESIVGSIASQGGAIATILPVLGLFFIWYKKAGDLQRNDWIFITGLMFIGFVSLKRAIWFIFPILLAFLLFYVPKKMIPVRIIAISVIAIPLIFYLGVRINPTLNEEHKIWGRFDINYAFNYATDYSFGEEEVEGFGRGGATLMLLRNLVEGDLKNSDWLGYGLRKMYATDYSEFADLGFGISSKGAATGVFQTMVSNGYIGIASVIWFAVSMILFTRNRRLRFLLLGYFLWEYFFYTGMSLREPALSFILIYIVLFSPRELARIREPQSSITIK
ncbi:MAG TPA: hypothetical protein VMV77_04500 [Bacteroidales bacterium]|nr:hypothetical protein [Bacteroidales bacterium]